MAYLYEFYLFLIGGARLIATSTACNLGVVFNSTLFMSYPISLISKSCFLSIIDLRKITNSLEYAIVLNTYHHIAQPLQVLVLATHYFWTLTSLNLIVFNSFSTLPHSQYLNHLNYATSILFSSLSTGSKLDSVLNIKSYLSPTKLFSLVNLLISIAF